MLVLGVLYVFHMAQSSISVRWSLSVCQESVFSLPHVMRSLDSAHILLEIYRSGARLWFMGPPATVYVVGWTEAPDSTSRLTHVPLSPSTAAQTREV